MPEPFFFFFAAAIGLLFFFRSAAKSARQAANLVSRGIPVTAKVIGLEDKRRSGSRKSHRLRYRFTTTGGVDYERETVLKPKEFKEYSEGQDIEVVYDPADPAVNMMKSMVDRTRNAMNKSPISE